MGKRSSFERIPRDFYPTPAEAVAPLLAHLDPQTEFCEPCAGDGALIRHLEAAGHVCVEASDIDPRAPAIEPRSFLEIEDTQAECFITNPPWERFLLHAAIEQLSSIRPAWLLFDADWMHTRQAAPFMPLLRKVVSVGRVKWIADSPFTGKDNCCWYLFDATSEAPAQFIGRAA
jgi:hypothetical protein